MKFMLITRNEDQRRRSRGIGGRGRSDETISVRWTEDSLVQRVSRESRTCAKCLPVVSLLHSLTSSSFSPPALLAKESEVCRRLESPPESLESRRRQKPTEGSQDHDSWWLQTSDRFLGAVVSSAGDVYECLLQRRRRRRRSPPLCVHFCFVHVFSSSLSSLSLRPSLAVLPCKRADRDPHPHRNYESRECDVSSP